LDISLLLIGIILLLVGGGLLYLGCRRWGFKRWYREYDEQDHIGRNLLRKVGDGSLPLHKREGLRPPMNWKTFLFDIVMVAIFVGIVIIFIGLINS